MSAATRMLCVGEAIVDLIGEEQTDSMRAIRRFAPHFGGTVANVALAAARLGAPIALAGAAGDDEWGRWLVAQLVESDVDVSGFELLSDVHTQLAFVAVDRSGEPTYELYGEPAQTLGLLDRDRLGEAMAGSAGLMISTNTLAGERERAITMSLRELALELGRPVVFDCNVRLHRWSSRADAAASANACVPGAALVRANQPEAELMTGEQDPERAALALRKAGAQLVAITLGSGGAILRGAESADVAAAPVQVLSAVGAGDVFTAVLLARLVLSEFYPAAVAAAMDEAAAAGARACERWGALD